MYSLSFSLFSGSSSTFSFSAWILPNSLTGNRIIYEEGGATNGAVLWLNGNVLEHEFMALRPEVLSVDQFIELTQLIEAINNENQKVLDSSLFVLRKHLKVSESLKKIQQTELQKNELK